MAGCGAGHLAGADRRRRWAWRPAVAGCGEKLVGTHEELVATLEALVGTLHDLLGTLDELLGTLDDLAGALGWTTQVFRSRRGGDVAFARSRCPMLPRGAGPVDASRGARTGGIIW
ncbi:hypothetical protein FXF51_26800 [Nonomuraea sp. PA05]|uniref:hypothetical protein n=1 Tax=Nonomuraea sp. PA05 TaxID=2604466 RepID=UPI0011D71646|nr:hypothetical protein [Nonomuraea sp. PA05]TYB62309.1 hypothetical protein FXF51_26800 [Nonomuraea sp. PA05]